MVDLSIAEQPSPFIGRASEIEQLQSLLMQPEIRCISIVGSGGVGKTRLALALIQALEREAEITFCIVSLASVNTREQIVLAIAQALGFSFYHETALEQQLFDYLRDKHMLLVLDNMEHLVGQANLLSEVLAAAPGIKLVVTSREQLNLRRETVFTIGGFSVIQPETPDDARSADAVSLFVQSARRTLPGFLVNALNLKGIYRIIQLAEGIPLVIELAAAWVNTLSVDEIADEIEQSAQFLEARFQDTPPRHWSIWATFQSSWERLTPEERGILVRLSVFPHSFTRKAAKQIASADMGTLQLLVQKSLLSYTEAGRFRIHHLLRQYLSTHLNPADDAALRQAYSRYYLAWLEQLAPGIKGGDQHATLDQIEQEFDHLRTAWETALVNEEGESIQVAQESLFWFCMMRNRYVEGERLFERVAAQPHLDAVSASASLYRLWLRRWREGFFQLTRGDRAQLEDLLAWFQRAKSEDDTAKCQMLLADAYRVSTDHRQQAKPLLEASLRHFQSLNDHFYTAWVLHLMSREAVTASGVRQAVQLQQQSLDLRQQIGDITGAIYALYNLSSDWLQLGALNASTAAAQEMLKFSLHIHEKSGELMAYSTLALNVLLNRDYEQSAVLNSKIVALAASVNHPLGQRYSFLISGLLALLQGQPSAAREYFQRLETEGVQGVQDVVFFFRKLGLAMLELGQNDTEAAGSFLSVCLRYALKLKGTGTLLWSLAVGAVWAAQRHEQKLSAQLSLLAEQSEITTWIQHWPSYGHVQAVIALEPHLKAMTLEAAAEKLLSHLLPDTPESQFSAQVIAANAALLEPLSLRELEVLACIAQGASNQEIADQLFVELSTVKKHITSIYGKLGVTSRTKAIVTAQEQGLV